MLCVLQMGESGSGAGAGAGAGAGGGGGGDRDLFIGALSPIRIGHLKRLEVWV